MEDEFLGGGLPPIVRDANRLLRKQPWLKRWFRGAHGIKPHWRKDNPVFLFQHNKDFL